MKLKYALLFIAIVAAALLTGCTTAPVQETAQPAPEIIVAPQVTFEAAPSSAEAGQEATIRWSVSGDAALTPHTAIHYGTSSVPNPTGPSDYAKATPFQCQITNCPIPSPFSATLKIDEPGTYYYRAHAVINGENVWSEEKIITIAAKAQPVQTPAPSEESEPKILITSAAPAIAGTNQLVSISWKIESKSATTPHTAVHFGPASVASPTGPSDYPSASSFSCTSKPCIIPRAFQTQISIPEIGTYYYRAHAIIGGKNFWSEEKTIDIVKPAEAPAPSGGGGGGY